MRTARTISVLALGLSLSYWVGCSEDGGTGNALPPTAAELARAIAEGS